MKCNNSFLLQQPGSGPCLRVRVGFKVPQNPNKTSNEVSKWEVRCFPECRCSDPGIYWWLYGTFDSFMTWRVSQDTQKYPGSGNFPAIRVGNWLSRNYRYKIVFIKTKIVINCGLNNRMNSVVFALFPCGVFTPEWYLDMRMSYQDLRIFYFYNTIIAS